MEFIRKTIFIQNSKHLTKPNIKKQINHPKNMKPFFLLFLGLCFALMLQAQVSKTLTVTAGRLASKLTDIEKTTVTNLTLTGTIDARDFKTMRDDMPVIKGLDLSGVSIAEYTGTDGTQKWNEVTTYPINSIPMRAFEDNDNIESVIIPSSVISIGYAAFDDCDNLITFTIPATSVLTTIESFAFEYCVKLGSIYIPNTVTSIGEEAFCRCRSLNFVTLPTSVTSISACAFADCSGLITVDVNNPIFSSLDGVLYNKDKSKLIQCPISKTGDFAIPLTVDSIGIDAFDHCKGLTSIIIPSSVVFVGVEAFYMCTSLHSIYCYSISPVTIEYDDVFYDVDKISCTLYVPEGSKTTYQQAAFWKDFTTIVELKVMLSSLSVTLSANEGSADSVKVTSLSTNWTATSDQTWLKVTPATGTGKGMLTFVATANTTSSSRVAIITVSASGAVSQTINIIQKAEGNGETEVTFSLSDNSILLNDIETNSSATVTLTTNSFWIATSDQAWLTLSPASGTGSGTIKFIATENPTKERREALVTLTVGGNITRTVSVYQVAGTGNGVDGLSTERVNIFPNPASNSFRISGIEGIAKLQISDLNGKVKFSKEIFDNEYLLTNALQKGIYLVKVRTDKGTIVKKLVKK
jgi:hypothetical protein